MFMKTLLLCAPMNNLINQNKYKNIMVVQADVGAVNFKTKFNFALLSGILIYLDDIRCNHLIEQLKNSSEANAQIILRDGTAMHDEHLINGKYSSALDSNYFALYRTRDKYISLMKEHGFNLVEDEDMFEKNSPLNKWERNKTSNLQIY